MKKSLGLIVVLALISSAGCANDGAWSVSDMLPDEAWVATDPVQCFRNPWEKDWLERHGRDHYRYPKDPSRPGLEPEEFAILQDYYRRQGVSVIAARTEAWPVEVCLACSCPEGHTLYLLVREKDIKKMRALGYRLLTPGQGSKGISS